MPEECKIIESPKARLQAARNRAGKKPEEIASAAGINAPWYYDLESFAGDIESGLPLGVLEKICNELKIHSSDLFAGEMNRCGQRIPLTDLVVRIKKHLEESGQTVSQFENKVGFEVRCCLDDSTSILEWDIECLQSVCKELAVEWKLALP